MFTQDTPRETQLACLISAARPRTTLLKHSLGYVTRLCLVVNCIDTEVRGGAGIFSPCVGGIGGQGGEFLVSEG